MKQANLSKCNIVACLSAARRMIDPLRGVLSDSTPYIIAGSIGAVNHRALLAGASAASEVNADYIHLEFVSEKESDGPSNVVVAMIRGGVCHIRRTCRFWLDDGGRPFLVADVDGKTATMSFAPDGMDSHPGAPQQFLQPGFDRAAERLRQLAATCRAPSNDQVLTIAVAA
jgi:hypothetical protein